MSLNTNFLKALRSKLQGDTARSIYLNCLPGRMASRLDLHDLEVIQRNTGKSFLELLLTETSFTYDITLPEVGELGNDDMRKFVTQLQKRLSSMSIENEDQFKETGVHSFGFGYPILVRRSSVNPEKILKAPVFIWSLDICRHPSKARTYTISRNKIYSKNKWLEREGHTVSVNEVLAANLNNEEGISLPMLKEELLEDLIFDKTELLDLLKDVSNSIKLPTDEETFTHYLHRLNASVYPLPNADRIALEAEKGNYLMWNGVFGLFKQRKGAIISDFDQFLQSPSSFELFPEVVASNRLNISPVKTDPSQQAILDSLSKSNRQIIQGPPGTGKSQTLTAILTNALLNDETALVICEKKTALEVLVSNLKRLDARIAGFAALVEDVYGDRDALIYAARERMEDKSEYKTDDSLLPRIESILSKLATAEKRVARLQESIFGSSNWTDLVGRYLLAGGNGNALSFNVDANSFQFSEESLAELHQLLNEATSIEQTTGNPHKHPVFSLNIDWSSPVQPGVLATEIESEVNQAIRDFQQLEARIQQFETVEIPQLINQLKSNHSDLVQQFEAASKRYYDAISQFGQGFKQSSGVARVMGSIAGIFSGAKRGINDERDAVFQQFNSALQSLETGDFRAEFEQKLFKPKSLETVEQSILQTKQLLEQIQPKVDVLATNLASKLGKKASELFSGLFSVSSRKVDLDALKSANQLELNQLKNAIDADKSKLHQLQSSVEHFRMLIKFMQMRAELNANERVLLEQLMEFSAADRSNMLERWFLYHALVRLEHSDLPDGTSNDVYLLEELDKLSTELIEYIVQKQNLKIHARLKLASNPVSLYNKRGSKGERRNPLRKIVHQDFELFTALFPIVMANPSSVSSFLPLKSGIFDLVLFDEASQLRLEDTFPGLIRGKRKVVSGDSQQMPPSSYFQGSGLLLQPGEEEEFEEDTELVSEAKPGMEAQDPALATCESLLEYAENANFNQAYLRVHYRSQHPDLIRFSNAAFYGSRLLPMPEQIKQTPIEFVPVNGLYIDQTNPDEANAVIAAIKKVGAGEGELPSVGVATLNLYQRNLILEKLSEQRLVDADLDKILTNLGESFFVKNLENVQGDERDVLIISTTFGKKSDGSFRQQFGPLLLKQGYKLLNVIITRAKQKVVVLTSIPDTYYNNAEQLLKEEGVKGKAAFYGYLAYAKAVSEGNESMKNRLLTVLSSSDAGQAHLQSRSKRFAEAVSKSLNLPSGGQAVMPGLHTDFIHLQERWAFISDGAINHPSGEAVRWERFYSEVLEKAGLELRKTYSLNWFVSAEKAGKRLLEKR